MPNGRNHGFVIQTRQKADELWRIVSASAESIAADGDLVLAVRKVAGYSEIRFLAFAAEPFSIRIEQGPTGKGPFVETQVLTSVAGPGGEQIICESVEPCGAYMRLTVENTGAGVMAPELQALGLPV